MEYIKISRDLSTRLQRSLSRGYFKKTPNSSNSSLTQSDYKSIIDKLDIANPEHGGSVDAIFSLLMKKNPDIEKNPEFRNIRNGINTEMFRIGGKYDHKLREYLGKAECIKKEMFNLVKKFYSSGYKIIAYEVMRQLSILSAWMDDAINEKDADKNKHKIKEIFSPDSDFHKSFLYLNKIKTLLQKERLKDELAKFSTEIHRNEKKQVVDIKKCIQDADVDSAVDSFFRLLADKDSKIINNYVSNTIIGRSYDALQDENPLSTISKIKDSFIEVDKNCNIAREANGNVGIFDINNKNSAQTYVKDKQKRFNDFKTMVLNIFENKAKYNAEKYQLKNKLIDFFFDKKIPSNHTDASDWGGANNVENIIKLFKAVVTEGGMKGSNYNQCERIARRVNLDVLINDLINKLNAIAPEADEVQKCLDDFIKAFNSKLSPTSVTFQSPQGQYFLKKHKGLNALSKGIRKITGGMSSGFDFITKSKGNLTEESKDKVIQISDSFEEWHDKQVADLSKGKKVLQQIAIPRVNGKEIDLLSDLIENLSPQDIEKNMKKYVPRMFEKNIQQNQLMRQAELDAKKQAMLLPFRLANDAANGNVYYPPYSKHYPNFYQSPYPLQGIYPQQPMLSSVDIQRIADAINKKQVSDQQR